MKFNGLTRTCVAMLTLAILSITTIAPAAEAGGRGKHRRGKSKHAVTKVVHHHHDRVIRKSDSGLGPAIVGFIGGMVVGTAIANSRDRAYEDRYDDRYDRTYRRDRPDYDYYDPYCEERFASFDACRSHQRSCEHPRVIQVVAVDSGECVDTYRYRNGGWHGGY